MYQTRKEEFIRTWQDQRATRRRAALNENCDSTLSIVDLRIKKPTTNTILYCTNINIFCTGGRQHTLFICVGFSIATADRLEVTCRAYRTCAGGQPIWKCDANFVIVTFLTYTCRKKKKKISLVSLLDILPASMFILKIPSKNVEKLLRTTLHHFMVGFFTLPRIFFAVSLGTPFSLTQNIYTQNIILSPNFPLTKFPFPSNNLSLNDHTAFKLYGL